MGPPRTSPLYLHPCPTCGAAVNDHCRTKNGKQKPGGHAARRKAAGMKPDKSGTPWVERKRRTEQVAGQPTSD